MRSRVHPAVTPSSRSVAAVVVLALSGLFAAVALVSPGSTTPGTVTGERHRPPTTSGWTGTWAAAVSAPGASGASAEGFTDTTVRQVAHLSVGGDRVRVRVSNTYGESPLRLGAATVALRRGPAGAPGVDTRSLRTVRFAGDRDAVVPVGAELVSEPVRLRVPADADLVVSLHLPGPTGPATWHPAGYATSFTAPGDATRDRGGAYDELDSSRYFVSGVDVATDRGPRPRGSVVFFGDSITDGVAAGADTDLRYPDQFFDRISRRPAARQCGVLNVGISGNRLLTDGAGESALARFDRDVLARPGARSVVLLEGINDIGGSAGEVDVADLVTVHRQFIARARDAGLRVVGATLLPYEGAGYFTAAGEEDRQALNRWIRTSGAYDDVVDLDRVMRDPRRPTRMLPAYDSGDRLHPDADGFAAMAEAVDTDAVC